MPSPTRYYARGKLLLTGEYAVLDGTVALAVPTRRGQWLQVSETTGDALHWQSRLSDGSIWLECTFGPDLTLQSASDKAVGERLAQVLQAARTLRPEWSGGASDAVMQLEFDRSWGLGSSSTLISLIAQWAQVDAFALSEATFGGSGYDVACATAEGALLYRRADGRPLSCPVAFYPSYADHLYFVHRNQKQDSRKGIAQYRSRPPDIAKLDYLTQCTHHLLHAQSLEAAQVVMCTHERTVSELIDMPPVQEVLFDDFEGAIKSLGAWGGDFMLVACAHDPTAYFVERGYETILTYEQMVYREVMLPA